MPEFRGTVHCCQESLKRQIPVTCFGLSCDFFVFGCQVKIFETLCFVPYTGNGIGKSLLSKVAQVRIFLMTTEALTNFNF